MNLYLWVIVLITLFQVPYHSAKIRSQNNVIEDVVDLKEFKKILRTKTNVLICFVSSPKQSSSIIKVFREVADTVKGQGTMVLIDCSSEAKKLCKKLKVNPEPYVLKHYKDGDFNKDYDRKPTVVSMVNFMREPTGDLPWEEDSSAENVVHFPDVQTMVKILKRETKPVMVMFYAPWCGFCKTLKPEYAAAATELKNQAVLAAIDVNRPENAIVRSQYNITGFPTLLYFINGKLQHNYEGENNRKGLVSFMKNPSKPQVKVKEPEWSDTDSEIVHLTNDNFVPVLKDENSALIMFYAPWCGHCKRIKPEYEKAASEMKNKNIPGMLAALDATKESSVASKFGVKGYPTLKYFSFGEYKFDVNVRDASKIVEFMRDPKEPPPPPPPEKPWSEEESEVVHLTDETFKGFLKKKKHVLVMFYAPWCGHCKKAKPEFTNAAQKFKDDPKFEFAAIDCTIFAALCAIYDVKGYPTLKYFNYLKNVQPYNGGRLETDFVKFMSDLKSTNEDSAATISSSSKEKPSTVTSGWDQFPGSKYILHITNNDFKEALKKYEYLFIMFHSEWCTHCKKMRFDFCKLAEEMAAHKESQITIAAIDGEENHEISEELEVNSFPALKLLYKGKVIADYTGKRNFDEMHAFLKTMISQKRDEL